MLARKVCQCINILKITEVISLWENESCKLVTVEFNLFFECI